jgi:hypothetical protein
MEYEAFCSLLENVPGQTQRLSAYDIITFDEVPHA